MPANHRIVPTVLLFTFGACERADSVASPSSIAPPALDAIAPLRVAQREPAPPKPDPAISMPAPESITDIPKPKRRTVSNMTRWFLGLSVENRRNVTEICNYRKANPCGDMLRGPRSENEEPARDTQLIAILPEEQRDGVDGYCAKTQPTRCSTPLVVAFESQPIAFAHATTRTFAFDPGEPVATDWPTAATPWIALDRDGDGVVSSGAELFGDSTLLPGGNTAANGFAALAALDANHDGVIDRRDPAFASLLLWADHDGDHASSPGELQRLADVIVSIPLANRRDVRCTDRDACEGERGTLRWRDAKGAEHAGAVVDVYLPKR